MAFEDEEKEKYEEILTVMFPERLSSRTLPILILQGTAFHDLDYQFAVLVVITIFYTLQSQVLGYSSFSLIALKLFRSSTTMWNPNYVSVKASCKVEHGGMKKSLKRLYWIEKLYGHSSWTIFESILQPCFQFYYILKKYDITWFLLRARYTFSSFVWFQVEIKVYKYKYMHGQVGLVKHNFINLVDKNVCTVWYIYYHNLEYCHDLRKMLRSASETRNAALKTIFPIQHVFC